MFRRGPDTAYLSPTTGSISSGDESRSPDLASCTGGQTRGAAETPAPELAARPSPEGHKSPSPTHTVRAATATWGVPVEGGKKGEGVHL